MDRNSVKRMVPSKWFSLLVLLMIPALAGAGQEKKKDQKPEVQRPAPQRRVEQPRPQPQVQQPRSQPQVWQSRPQQQMQERRSLPAPQTRGPQPQMRQQGRLPSPQAPGRQPQMRQQGRLPSPQAPGRQPQMREQRRLPGPPTNGQSPNIQHPGFQGLGPPSQGRFRTTTNINPSRGTQPGGASNPRPSVLMPPRESRQRVEELNRGRAGMRGINNRLLPRGQVSLGMNGRQTITTHDGRQIDVRPNRTVARVQMPDGRQADFRANGRIRSFRAPNGMVVQHGLRGGRRIVTTGPRRDRVVSIGPRRGYYERAYVRGYYQRTYWAGGRPYARIYRPIRWRGNVYYRYVPVRYYHPVFYAWAYRPWPGRIYYRWDWYTVRPAWYMYYGPYFAPSPWYPTASLWLTDFLIAQELQAAWQAQQDANAAAAAQQSAEYAQQAPSAPPPDEPPQAEYQEQGQPSATTTITPEVKQLIAEEVQRQLQAQQAAAANPQQAASTPEGEQPPLDPSQQVFVVSSNLDTTANGQECELTAGDVLYRIGDTPSENQTITMKVTSSKASDCPVRSTVEVAVEDLQEMQNDFRAKLDDGMDSLAKNQGQGGMPAAPDTATSPSGAPAPSPDSANYVQDRLQQQQSAANAAEGQVEQQALQDQSAQGNP
jgi:hypothetical protein